MMMILASPMGADLDMRNGSGGNRNKSQQNNATDPLAELDRMRAAMMQGNNFAAADGDKPVAKSSGLHGDFLKQSKDRRIEPPLGLAGARQPNTIYEGTLIRTVLTRSLRTDLPGRITAKVMSDVYDSVTMNTLLIPRGSEVTCTYQSELLTGQEVVLAACERLRQGFRRLHGGGRRDDLEPQGRERAGRGAAGGGAVGKGPGRSRVRLRAGR